MAATCGSMLIEWIVARMDGSKQIQTSIPILPQLFDSNCSLSPFREHAARNPFIDCGEKKVPAQIEDLQIFR